MSIRNGIVLSLAAATVGFAAQVQAAQVGTVFEIAMENHNWTQPVPTSSPQQILGNAAAPFINSLVTPGNPNAAQVSYASNYLNAGVGVHPSEPNYVWAEAGTDFGIHTDNDPGTFPNTTTPTNIWSTPHLTQQMNASGVTWNNYQEDVQISGNGPTKSASGTTGPVNPYYGTTQYNYAPKHNPMVFFTDTQNQNVKTFGNLQTDITNNTFAQYNWITPNQYNDMHSSLTTDFNYGGTTWTHGTDQEAVAIGDHFLSQIIPAIEATSAYQNNGAIVIWFDETENGDGTNRTIGEIVISPLAKGNAYSSSVEMNHSSDIKTMEEIFGLGSYLNNPIPAAETNASGAGYNTVSSVNDLSDLFQSNTIPTAVPEPASVGLLAIGGLALMTRRRKNA